MKTLLCETSDQRAIFDRIEERIDAVPKDGIGAEGVYSEHVHSSQRAYVNGLCAGRLAAIKAIAPCPYCSGGKSTGLPGNACENCMNTGLANPTAGQ